MKFWLMIIAIILMTGCASEIKQEVEAEPVDEEAVKAEVLERVKDWDHTWADLKDGEKLKEFFHENMVSITPSDHDILYGKAKNLEMYHGFMESSEVVSWELVEPEVHLYNNGKTAVLSTYYKITIKAEPENLVLEGRDLMTLVKEDENWVIVADQFSSFPRN